LQRIRKEAFKTTKTIYTEPFTSRSALVFWESSESYGEERNIEHEIFEAFKRAAIAREGFEKTLLGFQKQFSPLTHKFVISSDFEEEE
jgi:hypothetical protein